MKSSSRLLCRIETLFQSSQSLVDVVNSLSSGSPKIGGRGPVTKEILQKIVLLPIAPKLGTQEVNRFSQSPA